MADIVDRQTRSRIMSAIRAKDTGPELALRKALHARGFRYRIHAKHILGRPDLVLPKHGALIFVHGCFWHRHDGCRLASTPATRQDYWQAKFETNVKRDRTVRKALLLQGWRILVVWECSLKKPQQIAATADAARDWLHSESQFLEL